MSEENKLVFTPEHFENSGDGPLRKPAHEIAQEIHNQWLDKQPTMKVSKMKRDFDVRYDALPDYFQCRLVNVTKIEGEK